MKCEQCETREAVIHLTQIVDNELSTVHLCETCAAEKGLEPSVHGGQLPLADFLAQMSKGLPAESTSSTANGCSFCGLELDEFKKTGRLGCSHCYVTFEPHLKSLLKRLHGGTQHLGKVYLPPDPSEADRAKRLAGLRRKLERAVESEDFERAAEIRDQIRELEGAH